MPDEILEFYRGIPIRRYNKLCVRVSQFEIKKFIDAKIDHELSAREVLEYLSTPCECCRNIEITFYDKKDNLVIIKKGLLTNKNNLRM